MIITGNETYQVHTTCMIPRGRYVVDQQLLNIPYLSMSLIRSEYVSLRRHPSSPLRDAGDTRCKRDMGSYNYYNKKLEFSSSAYRVTVTVSVHTFLSGPNYSTSLESFIS